MLNPEPHSNCGILYIDDEEKALKYFRMAFSDRYTVFTAASGAAGLEILRREAGKIGIVLSDQRMPEMMGAEVLATVRQECPHIVRILTTAYSDLDSAIQAVNKGHIYQYVVKPWEITELGMVLQRAADYFQILTERNELLALKITTLQRILCADRLKWLLLQASEGGVPSPDFLRALVAFVEALPETLNHVALSTRGVSARDFEITSLILDEYRNATRCLGWLRELVSGLEPLQSALAETFGADVTISDTPEPSLLVQAKEAALDPAAFSRQIFGLLTERETPKISVQLFQALTGLAGQGRSLRLALAQPSAAEPFTLDFRTPAQGAENAEKVLAALAQKYASWDIARR